MRSLARPLAGHVVIGDPVTEESLLWVGKCLSLMRALSWRMSRTLDNLRAYLLLLRMQVLFVNLQKHPGNRYPAM